MTPIDKDKLEALLKAHPEEAPEWVYEIINNMEDEYWSESRCKGCREYDGERHRCQRFSTMIYQIDEEFREYYQEMYEHPVVCEECGYYDRPMHCVVWDSQTTPRGYCSRGFRKTNKVDS